MRLGLRVWLVLAVGLNSKEQLFQQASKKQLQEMWRVVMVAFPNALVYTPVIHFSSRLPLAQKKNLNKLNRLICNNTRFLNEILSLRFKEEPHVPMTFMPLIDR